MPKLAHRPISSLALCLFISLILGACSEKNSFPLIGQNVSRPIDIVASEDGQHFFVLNSNSGGTFADASILTLDLAGNKVATTKAPRLGRSLTRVGSDLIATFDADGSTHSKPQISLYTVGGSDLVLQKTWQIDKCVPINAAMAENYPYFAVSCENGAIALGELKNDRSQSTLSVIRDTSTYARRALLIDPTRELLLAFVTELGVGRLGDQIFTDELTWNTTTRAMESGANEIPDVWERSVPQRIAVAKAGSQFNFMMIDLKKAAAERVDGQFVHKDQFEAKEELRWIYFDFDDSNPKADQKHYRTNFWQAEMDETGECFYLSQRGVGNAKLSAHANNIVKACYITGADHNPSEKDGALVAPATSSYLQFSRVYGFPYDINDQRSLAILQKREANYFGAFARVSLANTKSLVVVSMRDFVFFDNPRYSLAVSKLDYSIDFSWEQLPISTSSNDTYFQLAVSQDSDEKAATVATCSYYDNSVRILRLEENKTSPIATVR